MREADIQRQILDYLTLKGIFHYRQNSGSFRRDDHFYRMGVAGAPDIIAVIDGKYIGIEVKAPGGKQNDNQVEFQRRLEKAGGQYIVATRIDDLVAALNR